MLLGSPSMSRRKFHWFWMRRNQTQYLLQREMLNRIHPLQQASGALLAGPKQRRQQEQHRGRNDTDRPEHHRVVVQEHASKGTAGMQPVARSEKE